MPKMRKETMTKSKFIQSDYFIKRRELGFKKKLGFDDVFCKKLALSLNDCYSDVRSDIGGIFNLEFSLNGSILAAACEKKIIRLYDSFNHRAIHTISGAHSNCVNCIKFIDHNTFASGSDDTTIRLWDIRFLSESIRTLKGHTNWVKNIEYSPQNHSLLTSAFDGSVHMWDLRNFTENNVIHSRVFFMDGLMRMKLTPDCSKMILCSTNGFLLVIHDLNLETLHGDLQNFKPGLYRLMQVSEQNIPSAAKFNKLFSLSQKRNRVELISDFPNNAEVISSLQIHPMGWCALTRNINCDETTEWTCVHDIQERTEQDIIYRPPIPPLPERVVNNDEHNESQQTRFPMDLWLGFVTNASVREQRLRSAVENRGNGIRTTRTSVTVLNSGIQERAQNNPTEQTSDDDDSQNFCKIIQNLPRLTHYIKEPNVGKGFIKELCFNWDGRIMCSPFNKGVRLFSFNSNCNELSMCVPEHPQQLYSLVEYNDYHPETVISCKFNYLHHFLVSGCLGGQIVWYKPKL